MKVEPDSGENTANDRETLIAAIHAAVKELPDSPLTKRKFVEVSGIHEKEIFRHFARWTDALSAAGFSFRHFNSPVSSDELLADWGRLVRKFGRLPTNHEQKIHGKHAASSIIRRFGGWNKVPDAFREFAGDDREWSDVLALLPPKGVHKKSRSGRPKIHISPAVQKPHRRAVRLPGRPVCGPPIDFAGLRHAPTNEAGVVFLFGAMAKELGFLIDSLQSEFPDCIAKRLVAPDTWQTVRIEFEYQSKNFLAHGHDPEGCDLIVCWEHNWQGCPSHLEVIALKEEVRALSIDS